MRKLLSLLLCLTFVLPLLPAAAEEAPLLAVADPGAIRPGKACLLTFTLPQEGLCSLYLADEAGTAVTPIVNDFAANAGQNQLWWNGTGAGVPAEPGQWLLTVAFAEETASVPVTVGSMAPYLTGITAQADKEAMTLTVDFYASVDGLLSVGTWSGNIWSLVESRPITAGTNTAVWNAAAMTQDTYALTLTLTDATGFPSNEEHIAVAPEDFGLVFATPTPEPTEIPTPVPATEVPATEIPATEVPAVSEAPEATPAPGEMADLPLQLPEGSLDEPVETAEPTATPEPTAAPTPDIVFTPSHGTAYPLTDADDGTYWGTPMDITDEAAVWAMLSSPITVIDYSMKSQTKVYAEPSEDSRTVAVVTGESQGVRVIEQLDNGWSLIECYSSTFHDNSIHAWNMLIQGYIQTDKLKVKDMSGKSIHIVVDKLTQRAYVFKDGALFTTLLISTGVANKEQPYNETRSGEFLYISPTGGFWSENMFCPNALKFNDGDLLHEVPYIQRNRDTSSSKIYTATEPYLGQRASHGCIRVQRKRTPEGVNMTWIWNNRKELGRIVVWEDWQGRQIDYPADDTVLYYNPKGGSYYHRGETCYSAKSSVKFAPFTYAELDTGSYAKLDYCPYCAPVLRVEEIDEVNEAHAFGGDHDPIMTACRQEYLEELLETMTFEELLPCEQRYYVADDEE